MNLPDDVSDDLRRVARYIFQQEQDEASGAGSFRFNAEASVDHVEDGDTWHGKHRPSPHFVAAKKTDDDFPPGQWYRLSKIDTHETDGDYPEKAKREKQFVEQFVKTGREDYQGSDGYPFYIQYESEDVEGSFGRLLVNLIRKSDGKELNEALLEEFGDSIRYQGTITQQRGEFVTTDLPDAPSSE